MTCSIKTHSLALENHSDFFLFDIKETEFKFGRGRWKGQRQGSLKLKFRRKSVPEVTFAR